MRYGLAFELNLSSYHYTCGFSQIEHFPGPWVVRFLTFDMKILSVIKLDAYWYLK